MPTPRSIPSSLRVKMCSALLSARTLSPQLTLSRRPVSIRIPSNKTCLQTNTWTAGTEWTTLDLTHLTTRSTIWVFRSGTKMTRCPIRPIKLPTTNSINNSSRLSTQCESTEAREERIGLPSPTQAINCVLMNHKSACRGVAFSKARISAYKG